MYCKYIKHNNNLYSKTKKKMMHSKTNYCLFFNNSDFVAGTE